MTFESAFHTELNSAGYIHEEKYRYRGKTVDGQNEGVSGEVRALRSACRGDLRMRSRLGEPLYMRIHARGGPNIRECVSSE